MTTNTTTIMGIEKPCQKDNKITALDVLSVYALSTRLMHSLTERKKSSQIKWLTVYVLELAKKEPGVTHAQIRRYYGTSCGALTGMLTENVNNGCLRATPDPADRRRSFYCTTELGKKYLEEVYKSIDSLLVPYNRTLTDDERGNMMQGEKLLNELVLAIDVKKYHTDKPYDPPAPDPFA